MKWNRVPSCPDWPLISCLTKGHWTQASAEVFENPSDPSKKHLHFYCTTQRARELYPKIKHLVPEGVVSVSFDNPWTVMYWVPKEELRVVKNDGLAYDEFEWLPEHLYSCPSFETPEEASQYIKDHYPQLQP